MYHRQGIHEKTVDAKREIESAQGSVSGPCRSTLEHVQSILTKADALFFKAHSDFQALSSQRSIRRVPPFSAAERLTQLSPCTKPALNRPV
jgi:hypothetical protein